MTNYCSQFKSASEDADRTVVTIKDFTSKLLKSILRLLNKTRKITNSLVRAFFIITHTTNEHMNTAATVQMNQKKLQMNQKKGANEL